MPRQERNKKSATKALAEAATKPGQLRLISLFDVQRQPQPSTSTNHGTNTEETTVPTFVEQQGSLNQTQQSNEIVFVKDPWVENANDFTNVDKEKSERSGRYFQREWLKIYTWLIFNRETNKAFCKTCASYCNDEAQKGVFGNYEVGFHNWKKGTEKLTEHEESHAHKIARETSKEQSISSVISSQILATQQLRRQGLISHLYTLKTLLRQGVPIRRNTDYESNIYQFDLDKARNDKGLKLLLDEKHYVTVHDVLMEQEQMQKCLS